MTNPEHAARRIAEWAAFRTDDSVLGVFPRTSALLFTTITVSLVAVGLPVAFHTGRAVSATVSLIALLFGFAIALDPRLERGSKALGTRSRIALRTRNRFVIGLLCHDASANEAPDLRRRLTQARRSLDPSVARLVESAERQALALPEPTLLSELRRRADSAILIEGLYLLAAISLTIVAFSFAAAVSTVRPDLAAPAGITATVLGFALLAALAVRIVLAAIEDLSDLTRRQILRGRALADIAEEAAGMDPDAGPAFYAFG